MLASKYKRWRRKRNGKRGERVRATRRNLAIKAKRRGLVGTFADWYEFAVAVQEQEAVFQEHGA